MFTWNMEWLMTPATHAELSSRCTRQQPRSHERALPCTPGRKTPPRRTADDLQALAQAAQALRQRHRADVVALQEVDGPAAARLVFQQGWQVDCFESRAHPQKVGFAIRDGVPYRCHGELKALDIDGGSRAGADITLWPGTPRAIRLLNVHLKSGCFDGKLDRSFAPCGKLREQVPVIERWIDARVREGAAFAVLGDFNRHLDKDARQAAGDDESAPLSVFQAWSDNTPVGATLTRATDGERHVPCHAQDTHSRYIDDVLVSSQLLSQVRGLRFVRPNWPELSGGKTGWQGLKLSDHCPVGITLTR